MKDVVRIRLTFPRSGQEIDVLLPLAVVQSVFGDHLLAA